MVEASGWRNVRQAFLRDWGQAGPRDLDEQTRRDELHGHNIFSPRVDDGEWLVHAFSWLGPLNTPRSMCWTTRNFESSAETSKPGRTQGLFPVQI